MVGNGYKHGNSHHDLRDDEKWGDILNKHLPPTVDYRKWECYGIEGAVAWCYHSYIGIGSSQRQYYEAEMSICGLNPKWATRRRITVMLSLFFNRNMYNRLTALIRSDNRQAVKLVKLAGFTLEGIIRKPANELDILQFSILKEEWEKGRFYELYR